MGPRTPPLFALSGHLYKSTRRGPPFAFKPEVFRKTTDCTISSQRLILRKMTRVLKGSIHVRKESLLPAWSPFPAHTHWYLGEEGVRGYWENRVSAVCSCHAPWYLHKKLAVNGFDRHSVFKSIFSWTSWPFHVFRTMQSQLQPQSLSL